MPALIAVTVQDDELAEPPIAIGVLLVLHVPPVVASLNVVVSPSHILAVPVGIAGNGFTVTIVVATQPTEDVKLIVAIPALTPVTMPVALPTLAAPTPALQLPLPLSVSDSEPPGHTFIVPVIAGGRLFTVTNALTVQPVPSEYVTGAVPALMPVTMPLPLPTLAALPLILHAPPPALLVKLVVPPIHTFSSPPIEEGVVLTVTP